jgi:hypothetical protein
MKHEGMKHEGNLKEGFGIPIPSDSLNDWDSASSSEIAPFCVLFL